MENNKSNPIVQAFIFETENMLEQIEQILLDCEESKAFTEDDVNEIFRIMHTIKGGAGMMNFDKLAELAHSIEDTFFYIREEKPEINNITNITDVILEGIDFMKGYLEGIKNDDIEVLDASDIVEKNKKCIEELKSGVSEIDDTESSDDEEIQRDEMLNNIDYISLDDEESNDDGIEEKDEVDSMLDGMIECFEIILHYSEGCEMENLRAFQVVQEYENNVKEIKYYPEDLFDDKNTASIIDLIRNEGFKVHIKTEWSYDEVQESVEKLCFIDKFTINKIEEKDFGVFKKASKVKKKNKGNKELKDNEKELNSRHEQLNHIQEQKRINVAVEKLDVLMDLVGELVLSETMVVSNPDLKGKKLDNFAKAARQHRKIISELQDTVMSIRMMPLSTTFSKMKRIVRDISKKLDKEMQIELIGEETEVDKNVIEQISDPLMHLVRNAADHGIESKQERKKLGKEEVGKITLEACNSGGDVLIKVMDNGRGLDKDKILEKAKKNGLIEGNENDLSEKKIFSMIFIPGFSTSEEVTEFSGRGVGMDVVRNNIEGLGGSISVDSTKEEGTTVTLKIPLTLAIVSGMIIRVGNAKYTVPIMSIRQSFRPSAEDIIVDTEGNEMVMVRGDCYIIRRLNQMYNVKDAEENFENGILILIENNDDAFCIFADEIIGEQQVVVKPLPEYVKKFDTIYGISGCTLLGDGDISLILDVANLNNN